MFRLLALFPLLFFCALLPGQSVVVPAVSSREDLQGQISVKQLERDQILAQMKQVALRADLSENTQFYLDLILDNLGTSRQPELDAKLQKLAAKRSLSGLDIIRLRQLEGELIRVYTGLAYLQKLSQKLVMAVPLPPEGSLQRELRFYALQDGERIGELGAGTTDFLRRALAEKKGLSYYLNDIDEPSLSTMAAEVSLLPGFSRDGNRVQVVRGTAHSSGLEQLQLDKVIIRNALHHFSAIPDMLQSVKESLGPGGKLLLKESFPDLCGEGCCEDLLSEERLLEVLREAGFHLESEQLLIDPEGFTWKLLCLGTGDS